MKPEELELIRYRLARATEAVEEARLLFNNKHFHTAVNRIYYACFYAVSALLLTERQSSPKHSGIRSLFDQLWIKPERLPKSMGLLYRRFFEMRQKGDYTDLVTFNPDDIQTWLQEAAVFVDKITRTAEEKIANNPEDQ